MNDNEKSRLAQSLRVAEAVGKIVADNRSGAAEILGAAAEVFSLLDAVKSEDHPNEAQEALRLVIEVCASLVRAQPRMAPLLNLASQVARAALESSGHPVESARKAAQVFLLKTEQAIKEAAAHAANLIAEGTVVLTHSRSSSVVAAFKQARRAGLIFEVIATESRPLFEGRTLARELAGEGIKMTMIADAAAALAVSRVDFVLVGADKITPEALINKIGTRLIALAAAERARPVYAVADSSKFISTEEASDESDPEREADELWPDAPESITISNRYFEPAPLSCFTSIIFEGGLLTPEQAATRARSALVSSILSDCPH